MKDLVHLLHQVGAVRFGEFTLKSGRTSPYYLDMKLAVLYPDVLAEIAIRVSELAYRFDFDSMGCDEGPGPSVVLGAVLSRYVWRPGFVVRKSVKEHGTKKPFEGVVGRAPIFLEDVVTSGGSTKSAIDRMPVKPVAVIALADRNEGGRELLDGLGIPFRSVLTAEDILSHDLAK